MAQPARREPANGEVTGKFASMHLDQLPSLQDWLGSDLSNNTVICRNIYPVPMVAGTGVVTDARDNDRLQDDDAANIQGTYILADWSRVIAAHAVHMC